MRGIIQSDFFVIQILIVRFCFGGPTFGLQRLSQAKAKQFIVRVSRDECLELLSACSHGNDLRLEVCSLRVPR